MLDFKLQEKKEISIDSATSLPSQNHFGAQVPHDFINEFNEDRSFKKLPEKRLVEAKKERRISLDPVGNASNAEGIRNPDNILLKVPSAEPSFGKTNQNKFFRQRITNLFYLQ